MVQEVLPQVPYVAPSFTIPKMLRKHFLWDRSLYGELSRTAYASVREFFQEHFPGLSGAVPAMVVSPQSFGSLANFHPHLHSVVSLGVFDREGNFHPAPDDIDFAPLEELFRQRTLKMMFQRGKITPERVELLRSWRHSGFHVDARRRLQAEDRKGLQNVLQYMERPPVALERLEYRSDGLVHYTGNYHPSLGRDHQLLPPLDFLALLVHHILLRFQSVIHCYGAASTTLRKRFGWISTPGGSASSAPSAPSVAVIEDDESEFVRLRRRNWARLIKRVWLEDPTLCPRCGKTMKVIAAISSPAQDDVIEKILRCLNLWNPPWLRQRRARGPPVLGPALQPSSEDTPQEPAWSDTIDPPHPEDYPDPPSRDD